MCVSTRTPLPPGRTTRSIRPALGAKLRSGSSALMRHSIECPSHRISFCEKGSFSPAAMAICILTRSISVTASVTEIDLVKMQIAIAAGEKLPFSQKEIRWEGHSIECRINAEDPERNFAPSAGRIERVVLPGGNGVRVDTHICAGYEVPPYYDPLLAKVIVWDKTRAGAIAKMQRALSEMEIVGVKTNIAFQLKIVNNAFYRRGEVSTDFIQRRILGDSANNGASP